MPYEPDGSFSLTYTFGTATPPNNQFPNQVGLAMSDMATSIAIPNLYSQFASITLPGTFTSIVVGSPTGGNLGTGTVNAQGVYVNDVAVPADPQLTSNIRQNKQNANYTLVLTDGEKHIYTDTTGGYTITVPANLSVAFPLGTAVTFVNTASVGNVIAITSDTLYWSPSGSAGSRTLSQYGMATAIKIDSTKWMISGSGLT